MRNSTKKKLKELNDDLKLTTKIIKVFIDVNEKEAAVKSILDGLKAVIDPQFREILK